jgi:Zn/Cd-binding protein ZinT
MVRITIDDDFKRKLSDSGQLVEIVDTNGRLVGRFVPEREAADDQWEVVYPHLSEQELAERLNSQEPTYTTEEVKDYLRKLS